MPALKLGTQSFTNNFIPTCPIKPTTRHPDIYIGLRYRNYLLPPCCPKRIDLSTTNYSHPPRVGGK